MHGLRVPPQVGGFSPPAGKFTGPGFCYHQNVREVRITRALAALGCIAVLVWCTAIGPASAHLDFGIPVLAFAFLAILTPLLFCLSASDPAAQPLAFLSISASRAPPLA